MAQAVIPCSVEKLRTMFSYDPETGRVTRLLGRFMGNVYETNKLIKVGVHQIKTGRVIWALHYGYWPDLLIDHRNGDDKDFRIGNLREATHAQNQYNKVGVGAYPKGVVFKNDQPRPRPYQAKIRFNGRRINLGCFATAEEAGAAYRQAAKKLHGEFSLHESMKGSLESR